MRQHTDQRLAPHIAAGQRRAFDGACSAAFLKRLKDEIETRDWVGALGS